MESKADMLSRVCLMAEGDSTWSNLTKNDMLALRYVLAERNEFKQSSELSALRIRELEAEIAVRDNMGNEVLRILREATGKRDFHSEMEAAEWAAKMLADVRLDSARLDWLMPVLSLADGDGDLRAVALANQVMRRAMDPTISSRAAIDAAMKVPQ